MVYSLTYNMMTGKGRRLADTASDAALDHAALLLAGATGIVIRDNRSLIVSLASVVARGKLETNRR